MQVPQAKLAQSRLVRREPIRHDLLWLNGLVSQQAPEQLQGCIGISPSLNDNIQHLAFVVHGTPQKHALYTD